MIHLLWNETELTVVNPPEFLRKKLIFKFKEIDNDKVVRYDYRMFEEVENPELAIRGIKTHHGMLSQVRTWLEHKRLAYSLTDLRLPFPKPRMDLMHGFRCNQRELLVTALMQNQSGLLGAPTRYGKTILIINTLRAFPGVRAVVTAPGVDLCRQLLKDLGAALPERKITGMFSGKGGSAKYPSDDITVCSMDSLHKVDPESVQLLLVDEPHACVAPSRENLISAFSFARKYGFGATLKGRFDGKEPLIVGLLGPILANRTYAEAVAEGAICPLVVLMLRCEYHYFRSWNRRQAYNKLVHENATQHDRVKTICDEMIPQSWQTIAFVQHEKQANALLAKIPEGTIAMAKVMSESEREALLERMKLGEVRRCLASIIYSQGVTFSDVRAVVNAMGGGANLSAVQKPGRVLEIRPNKKVGILIDFFFELKLRNGDPAKAHDEPCVCPWIDSMNRLKLYRETGYEIRMCNDIEHLRRELSSLI